jgi:hypothetical protein
MKGVQALIIGLAVLAISGGFILGGLVVGLRTGNYWLVGVGIGIYAVFVVWANWEGK